MISLFTAIEIPELIASQLGGLQRFADSEWDPGWIPEENFHITLAYIGPVEEPQAADIDGELSRLKTAGFELELKGVGAFGGKRPQVLYAAVAKSRALEALAEKHHTILRRLGVEMDKGTYTPHVSLARPRHAPLEIVQHWIGANNLYDSGPFPADRAVLFSSHKVGDGRHYEPERFYPFGPHLLG